MLIWISVVQHNFRKYYLAQDNQLCDLPYKTPFTLWIKLNGYSELYHFHDRCLFDVSQRVEIYNTVIFIIICFIVYFAAKRFAQYA